MKKCIPVIIAAFVLRACSSQTSNPKRSLYVKATVVNIPTESSAYTYNGKLNTCLEKTSIFLYNVAHLIK